MKGVAAKATPAGKEAKAAAAEIPVAISPTRRLQIESGSTDMVSGETIEVVLSVLEKDRDFSTYGAHPANAGIDPHPGQVPEPPVLFDRFSPPGGGLTSRRIARMAYFPIIFH